MWALLFFGTLLWPGIALATPLALSTPPTLAFAEISITGSNEFLVIQNNSGSTINDLSIYWIYQHNKSNPAAAGATTTTQQLPSAKLNPGQTILLSANAQNTCGAAVAGRLSVSLVDSEGSLELLSSNNGTIASTDTDFVSWNGTSPTITDAVASASPQPVFYRYQSGSSSSWKKAILDPTVACQLDVAGDTNPVSTNSLVTATDSPSAVIVAASATLGIPFEDEGLIAPQITELLPNPTGTGNDGTDEFVELYNPNNVAFDLSGFTIETGLTTKHDFTFDSGSSIPAKSFVAYYSSDTNLTLSNSGGQAWLLDPDGNIISQSEAYGSAKDGQSWALANGAWYWTTKPTPNGPNVISQPVSASSSKTKTTPTTGVTTTSSSTSTGNNFSSGSTTTNAPPIHPWTLAAIGSAALLYAGYEYRADLANRLYQFRRYREARAAAGAGSKAASGSGIGIRLGRWQNDLSSWLGKRFK